MQPDLELRELIATKLMGYELHERRDGYNDTWLMHDGRVPRPGLPAFELKIGPAFQAVEAMRARGYKVSLDDRDGDWHAHFTKRSPTRPTPIKAIHTHLPYAIALAIREALESEGA